MKKNCQKTYHALMVLSNDSQSCINAFIGDIKRIPSLIQAKYKMIPDINEWVHEKNDIWIKEQWSIELVANNKLVELIQLIKQISDLLCDHFNYSFNMAISAFNIIDEDNEVQIT